VQERENEETGKLAQGYFEQGRRALAAGDYPAAVDALTRTVELSAGRNWAWFWLGQALCESGKYDEAIYRLTKVIDMTGEGGLSIPSYYLARARAYQGRGMVDMAQLDFEKALPKMIESLRNREAGWSFDLADDPLRRADGMRAEDCHGAPTPEQSLVMMINRLRLFTGQNFAYDPNGSTEDKERAIAAWEQWSKAGGQIRFTPEAQLIAVPSTQDP
jgi:tetratricopeptide (TPR) repeat protein